MSDYPESADIFVDKTGADNIASSDPNNSFDAIEAVQGFLGALGKPQSWSETLLDLLRYHRRGFRVKISSGAPVVETGEAMLIDTAANMYVMRRNAAEITIAAGDLDVGTMAATFYYIYAKGGTAATTAPMVFSTDINAPSAIGTIPYHKIGWFKNEAVGSLSVTFAGNWKVWGNEPNSAQVINTDYQETAIGTAFGALTTGPPLTINFVCSGRPLMINYSGPHYCSAGGELFSGIHIDGTNKIAGYSYGNNAVSEHASLHWVAEGLVAGAHVIEIRYKRGGSAQINGAAEKPITLTVHEL